MIHSYITIAIRNIFRNRTISAIHVIGLGVGMACAILIFLWIHDELSYDKFLRDPHLIYRATLKGKVEGTEFHQTYTSAPFAAAFREDFPQVEEVVRIGYYGEPVILVNHKNFGGDRIIRADPTLFKVLNYNILSGDSRKMLTKPNSIVLTQHVAEKYFGNVDVLQRTMVIDDAVFTITGILKDLPQQTHLHFDMIIPMSSSEISRSDDWNTNAFYTYFRLKGNCRIEDVQSSFKTFIRRHYKFSDVWFDKGNRWEIVLQPITEIHLKSEIFGEFETNGSATSVKIFSIAALLIIILAIANYINLTTSLYVKRAKEIGIRKVNGANRAELIKQFMTESLLISFISFLFSLGIILTLLPFFNEFTGKQIVDNMFTGLSLMPYVLASTLFVGILAGILPSIILSSQQPAGILSNQLYTRRSSYLRITLIMIQFVISVILITGSIFVFQQLNFMQHNELGFDKENVLVIQNNYQLGDKHKVFKTNLLTNPSIESISGSNNVPGSPYGNIAFTEDEEKKFVVMDIYEVDKQFLNTMKIQLRNGRFFLDQIKSDSTALVINKAACDFLNMDEPMDKKLVQVAGQQKRFKIIGVTDDFHYSSMHQAIRPQAFLLINDKDAGAYISIKIHKENRKETIAFINDTWKSSFPDLPFKYTFMKDLYRSQYANELQLSKIMTGFAILSLLIAISGLFGLVTFLFDQHLREVSIRKVMGASNGSIFIKLMYDFLKWIFLSCIIGFPVIWYFIERWLTQFAYRIQLSWQTFMFSGCIILTMSILVILIKTWRVTKINPVEVLNV
ncbi:MAG: ABC transporter permease [Bacteroidia bacterium]|nr:ABC transporter permease [Bacteroidia bacterium]